MLSSSKEKEMTCVFCGKPLSGDTVRINARIYHAKPCSYQVQVRYLNDPVMETKWKGGDPVSELPVAASSTTNPQLEED